MLAIQNDNGLTLQLTPGQNLVTELATNWLSDEDLPAEFSYPIDCPLNDNNQRFVGYGYRPDHVRPQRVMAVTVKMEGVLYRRCQFAYRVQGGKLNGYLKIDSAEVYDRIRKLTLLEALPDVIKLGNGLIDGYTNAVTSLAQRMKVIAGMPPGSFPLTFFPIRNEAFLEDSFDNTKLAGYQKRSYVNHWEGSGFKTDSTATAGGYLVVPQLYLWWVLERIMAGAGYRIESDWLASEEVQRLVVVNQTAMAVSGLGQGDPAGILNGHSIVAGMHLPDMSVSDFLKAIKGRFGLNFTYNANDRICHITTFVGAVAAGPALDLTQYQSGRYDTQDAEGRGYTVRDYIDESDELYKNDRGEMIVPDAFVMGQGGQDVSLKVGTTQLIYAPLPPLKPDGSGSGFFFVPTVSQPGNVLDKLYKQSERFPDEKGRRKNNIGLKLLSYRGLVAHSAGNLYPLATPDVRDGLQQIIGTQALNLAGARGAWRTGLRAYYYFRDNTQKISQPLLLPVAVLAQLKLYRSVQLSLEDQIRRSYLISKVQAEDPGPSGLSTVRLDVLSLPPGLDLSAEVDEPAVWVEIVLGERRPQAQPAVTVAGTYPVWLQSITVRCWQNAQKSAPAIVTNLPVTLRQYMPGRAGTPTQESVTTYLVNGSSTLVENNFLAVVNVITEQPLVINIFDRTVQLDPGEGYLILR